jgi:hypothetical protein
VLTTLAVGLAASGAVTLEVRIAGNVAETTEPSQITLTNGSPKPIELTFIGPRWIHLVLERQVNGVFVAPTISMCLVGSVQHVVEPHEEIQFPLWRPGDAGPGATGRYRIALSYVEVGGPPRRVYSDAFYLRYGDVKPPGWTGNERRWFPVLIGSEVYPAEGRPGLGPLATALEPELRSCVTQAWKSRPWLRGRFDVVVAPQERLSVNSSTLGGSRSSTSASQRFARRPVSARSSCCATRCRRRCNC